MLQSDTEGSRRSSEFREELRIAAARPGWRWIQYSECEPLLGVRDLGPPQHARLQQHPLQRFLPMLRPGFQTPSHTGRHAEPQQQARTGEDEVSSLAFLLCRAVWPWRVHRVVFSFFLDLLCHSRTAILQNLSFVEHAPSVQMQHVPPDTFLMDARRDLEQEEDDQSMDAPRVGRTVTDRTVDSPSEFFDDDKDQEGEEDEDDLPDLLEAVTETAAAPAEAPGKPTVVTPGAATTGAPDAKLGPKYAPVLPTSGPAPKTSIMSGKTIGGHSFGQPSSNLLGKRPAGTLDQDDPVDSGALQK